MAVTDWIGSAIGGGLGLAKMIIGGVQWIKGRNDMKNQLANMPKYTRPEEYNKLLSIYQQQAGMGELPGQAGYEAALSTRTARGTRSAAKYADSPVAAVAASMGLYGQEQQAVRDLGLQFADYKTRAQQQLAGAYQVGMQEAGKEFSYNQWYPSQVRLNMAQQRMNGGQQNFWGGLDTMAAAGIDFASNYAGANNNPGAVNTTPQQTAAMQTNINNTPLPYPMQRIANDIPGSYNDYNIFK